MTTNKLAKAVRSTGATPKGVIPDVFQFIVRREPQAWVFDDPLKSVTNEPFVCGMNEIIDAILERHGIPATSGQRIRATFCDERAVDAGDVGTEVSSLDLLPALQQGRDIPMGYTPYQDPVSKLEGAFCPVFKLYFPDGQAPERLLLFPEKV
jgi:hypothetical protein